MNEYLVVVACFAAQVLEAVYNGVLESCATGTHPLDFGKSELLNDLGHMIHVALEAHDLNGIDFGMVMKDLNRIRYHGLSENLDKLLRNVEASAAANTAS